MFEPATTCITFYLRDLVCQTVLCGLVVLKNYPSIKLTKCYSEFWWCVRSRNICWPTNSSNKDRQLGIVVKNPGRKQIELNFFNNIVSRSIFKQTIFILFCDDMFFFELYTYLSTCKNRNHTASPNRYYEKKEKKKFQINLEHYFSCFPKFATF